jgi:hypothetical protein
MMSEELFVTNLVSGKAEASQKMRWWLRHSGTTSLYLQKWRSRKKEDGVLEREKARTMLEKGCAEWNGMVYKTQRYPFMCEHAALEMMMVDLAMGPEDDATAGKVTRVFDRLMENVDKQIAHHRFVDKEFPTVRWKDLLFDHARLFTESIRWYITPDKKRYAQCEESRTKNTILLAAFSTEWF